MRSLALIFVSLGLAACAADEGDESIIVSKNVVPGDMCTFGASSAEQFLPHGEVSAFAKRGYTLYPQLTSRIVATDAQLQQRTITLKGARVDLTFPDPALAGVTGIKFESRFSGPLAPNGGITDVGFELIPTSVIDQIRSAIGATPTTTDSKRAEVIAKVVIFGDLSGDEVTSASYEYPVTVCNDCVTNVIGTCPLPAGSVVGGTPNPCNPYQDGTIDCCAMGNDVVCPATVVAAPTP